MQKIDKFPTEVTKHLKFYVYRLIDPRYGETFYVGKGEGDRIFQHVKGALLATEDEDETSLKISRIKAILKAGLDVGHVIHRHHIVDESVALEIEAALIDAYPGLTNEVSGHGSGEYGCRHVEQIIAEYAAEPFVVKEPLILININKSYEEEGKKVYDAVRGVWIMKKTNAEKYKLVLAHCQGVVVGVFRPKKWLPATKDNFPWLPNDLPKRIGFEGVPAEQEVESLYLKKRVPDEFRRKGTANPVSYRNPS
jgi:hypothetical protein